MMACRNAVGMNKAAISVAVLDEPDAARVSASQETRHHLHLASQSQAHPQPSFGALESDPLFQTRSLEWAERCSGAKFKSAGGKTGQPNALGSMRLSAQHCTFLVGEVIKPILVLAANGCFVGEDGETGGTGLVFSVQPQLPKGLQIDKLSGMIFGTKSPPGRHLLTCFTHTHTLSLSHTHSQVSRFKLWRVEHALVCGRATRLARQPFRCNWEFSVLQIQCGMNANMLCMLLEPAASSSTKRRCKRQ